MKVGIIPSVTRTGEGRYSKFLINGLRRKGINIEIFQNFILNKPNKKIFLGSFLLKRMLKDKRVSILHNLDNLSPYLIKHANTKIKLILTVHDIAPVILPHLYNWVMRFDFKVILPKLIGNSDFIITPSYSTKKDLISKFGVAENKVEIVPMGIDTSTFYPRISKEEILKKYGIQGEYILYVGNDNPRKNLKNLILAYHKISSKVPHNLVLTGPINKNNIRKIINKCNNLESFSDKLLNRIIILGYVDYGDLPVIYSAANTFLFPSFYEGFAFPVLEAMACGTPVVASDRGSLKEITGESVIYVDPLDIKNITEGVLKSLKDKKLRGKLTHRSLEIVKKYDWRKTVNKTVEVYHKVLSS